MRSLSVFSRSLGPDGARQNRPLIGRPVRLRRRAGEKGVLLRILSPKQELKQDLVQNRR